MVLDSRAASVHMLGCVQLLLLCPWDVSILEWVAVSSSRGSSQPRDQTGVCLHIFLSFCIWGSQRQVYWGGLPFPLRVGHVLSELSTVTRPSWVVLRGMAHSFIELHKPLPQQGRDSRRGCANHQTVALISHASKILLKMLQCKPRTSRCPSWL